MFQFQKNMGEHDIQTSKRKLKEFISPCIQTAIKNHKPEDLESEVNLYANAFTRICSLKRKLPSARDWCFIARDRQQLLGQLTL